MKPVYGVHRYCATPYEADSEVGYYAYYDDAVDALEKGMRLSTSEGELWRIREWYGEECTIIEELQVPEITEWGA